VEAFLSNQNVEYLVSPCPRLEVDSQKYRKPKKKKKEEKKKKKETTERNLRKQRKARNKAFGTRQPTDQTLAPPIEEGAKPNIHIALEPASHPIKKSQEPLLLGILIPSNKLIIKKKTSKIMLENEIAETLMSLSAPDERKFGNPLHAKESPWQSANKKRSFNALCTSPHGGNIASSLPNSSYFQDERIDPVPSFWQHQAEEETDEVMRSPKCEQADMEFKSPLEDLCDVASRDQSNQDDNDVYSSGSSRPISIPSSRERCVEPFAHLRNQKWGLSRVREDSYVGEESSPTGVEDDSAWFENYRHSDEYHQRARLASICSSDGGYSDSGLGRKHLEEFIRMEISESKRGDRSHLDTKYVGSYSPEARRKRIERFLEKRKKRVWSKKVDYDVRKNFANSRLRVKGRFVKKEDEELLCELMSFT
jgi:hypothetical protein